MTVNGNGEITAIDNSVHQGRANAFGDVSSTNRDGEGAVVAVKIIEAAGHLNERVEVFGVGQAALSGAMRGNDLDAAFEGQG